MNGPRPEYERRLQGWRDRIAALDRVHLRVSNSRLAVAAIGAVFLWLVFIRGSRNPLWSAGAMVTAVVFGGLVVFHGRLLHRLERARRAEQWYARGVERLNGRWTAKGRNGARFLESRAYARDLDLFGGGSVFELLNTAATEAGEETLAGWISAGAPIGEVMARQAAVAELREKLDFREDLAVLSAGSEVSRTGAMAAWAAAPGAGLSVFAAGTFGACALVMVAIAALVFTDRLSSVWLVLWSFVEALLVAARAPGARQDCDAGS